MAKKQLNTPEKGSIAALMGRMADMSGLRASTGEEYSSEWRYLTFVDPKTGLPSLAHEYLVGAAGFRAGTINQLRGLAGTGKSSLCMLEYASAVRNGGAYCAHLETEGAGMRRGRIAEFGLNPKNLVIPDDTNSFEKVVEFVDTLRCLIRGGDGGSINDLGRRSATKFKREDAEDPDRTKPILIGIDSLSNLGKDEDTKNDISDMSKSKQPGWLPRQIKAWFREKAKKYERDLLTLFLTSQETTKIQTGGGAYLPPEKTSVAGDAIKFFDTIAIDMSIKDWKDDKTKVKLGREMTLKVFKNKLAGGEGKKVVFYLTNHDGFDMIHTDVEFLLDKAISPFGEAAGIFKGSDLIRRDAWGITCKPLSDTKFKTEEEFIRALYANEDLLATIRNGMRIYGYGLPHEDKYKANYGDNLLWKGEPQEVPGEASELDEDPGDPEEEL